MDGGVNSGPILYCLTSSIASARSSGVKSIRSSIVDPCRSNGGGLVGNGCVGAVRSPGVSDAGTGRSSIGHTGLSGRPIEHECERLLRQLHDRLDRPSADGDVRENRRGRQVVVPQIVVDDLVVPDAFAGERI